MDSLITEARSHQSRLLAQLHSQMDDMEQRLNMSLSPQIRAVKLTEFAPAYIGEVLKEMITVIDSYPAESPDHQFLSIFSSKLIAAWKETAEQIQKATNPTEFQTAIIDGLDRMIVPAPEEKFVSEFVKLPVHESVRLQLMVARNILSENDLSGIAPIQDELPLVF